MKVNKILIILIVLVVLILITNPVFALNWGKSIPEVARDWLETGQKGSLDTTKTDMSGFQQIAGLLLGLGIFIAIIVGIILGIRFMVSAPEGKAQVSKLLTPFIIGVLLVVGALAIWKILVSILDIK